MAINNGLFSMGSNPFGGQWNSQDPWSGAAYQTALGNQAGAQYATQANRVNQTTPYGSLNYSSSTDQYGNPVWSATQSVSPEVQNLVSGSLSNLQSSLTNPAYGINPGQSYTDAIMQRLQPQLENQQESFDVKMANQGIPVGSEAYKRAYRDFSAGQNDARTSAIVGGMNTGLSANKQAYDQQLANANLAMQKYNMPLAQLAAFQNVSQPGFVNPAAQSNVAGADITSAMGLTNQSQQANANAANAQNNAMLNGLFSLAGGAIGAPKGTISNLFK